MFRSGFTDTSLRRCYPNQVENLSVRRVSTYHVSVSSNHKNQLKPRSCRGVAECGIVDKCSKWGAIRLRPSAKNSFHKTSSVCSWSGNPNVSFPISTNSSHLDVAIDHETLQPQRWCCDLSDTSGTSSLQWLVASNLIPRLGLSTPSPNPFAWTSTPCCCKITPRSRFIETQPIPSTAMLRRIQLRHSRS